MTASTRESKSKEYLLDQPTVETDIKVSPQMRATMYNSYTLWQRWRYGWISIKACNQMKKTVNASIFHEE